MPPINGRAILEGFGIGNMFSPSFGIEIIYSFVIIICSLMIYFGTRELYELSSHKGIKYFRLAFLFFALAYFFRSFIKYILIYFDLGIINDLSPKVLGTIFGPATLFIFMYFSSIAIFYLLYSVAWKKIKNSESKLYLFHLLAIIMASFTILTTNHLCYLFVNLVLFGVVLLTVFISKGNKKKKKNNLYAIYVLLSSFWILNIIDILVPEFVKSFQLLIYIASIAVFLTMLYKVLKKVGSN